MDNKINNAENYMDMLLRMARDTRPSENRRLVLVGHYRHDAPEVVIYNRRGVRDVQITPTP